MSDPLTIDVSLEGIITASGEVQAVRSSLRDRSRLHNRIAGATLGFTQTYVRGLNRHRSAERLGANPSGHHETAARGMEQSSDAFAARLRIPSSSGLRRAFVPFRLRPTGGRTYLTIPADKRVYGRRVGEFPPDTFRFTIIAGRFPALVFAADWSLAYWLRREVNLPQDRTLLPSAEAYSRVTQQVAADYISGVVAESRTRRPSNLPPPSNNPPA